MVICLERGAETCIQPLPLTISCFNKIQIDFTLLVPAHLGSPRKRAVKRVCVCVRVCVLLLMHRFDCHFVGFACAFFQIWTF